MKRSRDVFDSTPSSSSPPLPLLKRPATAQSSPAVLSTPHVVPKRPACSSPWASTIPHDSPSNPFGLNRALRALTLPRPSGFGKHIVLRLQIVSQIGSRPSRSRRPPPQGPYRIVQVPLNYSFRLLHMLILFLLASDARLKVRRPRRVFSPPHKPTPSLNVFGESPKKEGHLFEVFEDVSLYANHYRPGVIKAGSGKLYARLSSARERSLFPEGHDDDDAATSDEDGWDWEGEDDFFLSNVWPDGPDLKKGIIYHHTPSTIIHITVNQVRLFPRKGAGNTPYVFTAVGGTNGAVRIANVASGPAPKDDGKENIVEILRSRRKKGDTSKKTRPLEDNDNFVLEEVDDLDDGELAVEAQFERWNADDAFRRFLKREAARERAMRRHPDTPPSPIAVPKVPDSLSTRKNFLISASSPGAGPSAPSYGRTYSYAIPHAASSSSSLAPSSPSTLPVPLDMSDVDVDFDSECGWSESHPSSDVDEETRRAPLYQIELPFETPIPSHPGVRRRVTRVSKRIERETSKGLSEFSDEDEDEVEEAMAGTDGKAKVDGKAQISVGKHEEDDPEWGQGSPSKMPSSRPGSRASAKFKTKGKANAVPSEEQKEEDKVKQQAAASDARAAAVQQPAVAEGTARDADEDDDEERDELYDEYEWDNGYDRREQDEDSEDEFWDVGPTWFGPPVVDEDWDPADEL